MSQYYICRYTPPIVVQSPTRANYYTNYSHYSYSIPFHTKMIIPIVIIYYDFIPKILILLVLRIIKFVLLYEKQLYYYEFRISLSMLITNFVEYITLLHYQDTIDTCISHLYS